MKRRLLLAVVLLTATLIATPRSAEACAYHGGGTDDGVLVGGICSRGGGPPSSGSDSSNDSDPVKTVTILCGRASTESIGQWNKKCGAEQYCYDTDPKTGKRIQLDAYGTFAVQNGQLVLLGIWCPFTTRPQVTPDAVRQQVLRLLPSVGIGSAPDGYGLVNAETVLWADTESDRSLPTVTVVGQQVQLRIHFDHATWDFGDGTSDTTTEPGTAYSDADPCTTAQCADYFGHTYSTTGSRTVTLTVAWRAQFSLDGQTWTDVDAAPLTGPATTQALTIREARGILVH